MSLVDGKILEISSDQALITKVILLTSKGSLLLPLSISLYSCFLLTQEYNQN